MDLYNLTIITPPIKELADLILEACRDLHKAIVELRDLRNIRVIADSCIRINSIENQADDVFNKAVAELFDNENKNNNNNINIGGKSILSNIIQSNSDFNNLEHIAKEEIKDYCFLIFKITNLLLSWKDTLENKNNNNNKYSYILRIDSCLKLLDSFMKNIDKLDPIIEYLEIFYQHIHISHAVWIKLLEEIILDKKDKKKNCD
jgi:hypothetical protein